MSYESRVYIVNVIRENDPKSEDYGKARAAEIISQFNLSSMGYNNGWRELFNKPIDFEIYAEDGDVATSEDKYGAHLQAGDLGAIIDWLEAWPDTRTYRRIPPFLAALNAINPGEWDELKIVHYGY